LIAGLGVILILFGTFKTKKDSNDVNDFSCELYTNELEEKIEKFLLNVEGIKNVNVIVTLDTSNEKKYAQDESTFDYITITSGGKTEPLYLGEIYPYVRGVAISCTNGDSDEVKIKITKLISAYLGISSNRIEIVSFG
jgi:hypothetical protein